MRTLATLLIVDIVLLVLLLLAWADWLRPIFIGVVSVWSSGWIVAAYVFLIPGSQNVGASLGCFAVAIVSLAGMAFVLRDRRRNFRYGMVGK